MTARYYLTGEAAEHLSQIASDTAHRWGRAQVGVYISALRDGFQHIADNHPSFPLKKGLTGVASTRLHRVNRHYIAFRVLTGEHVVILAVLHERMDVDARLREMQTRNDDDIGDLRAKLLRDMLRGD